MPKRKRDPTDEGSRPTTSKPAAASNHRATEKIHHGKKLLHRALKLAKGFERQKLSRRQKLASKNNDDTELQRINDEITALKNLDLVLAAEAHLHKTLMKEKAVAIAPALPEEVKVPPRPLGDRASVNVVARLYNANPVKEAMAEVLPAIRAALGVETGVKVKGTGKGKGGSEVDVKTSSRVNGKKQEAQQDEVDDDEDEEVFSEEDSAVVRRRVPGEVEEDDDENDYARFDTQVVGSSEDEGDESVEEEEDLRPFRERTFSPSVDGDVDFSPPSPSSSTKDSPPPPPETTIKAKEKKEAKRPDTSFLPSLTMGGYWSGSESDAEEVEDIDVAPRKNRRGQRARQQIAEKKFGKNAKHLQKQAAGKGGRDDGWDMKRGAKEGGLTNGAYKPAWMKERNAKKGATGENATPLGKREEPKPDADKPIHPSWQAAKKAKEATKIDLATVFTGKKMVF